MSGVALTVLAPGLHSTVQDLGRFGYQELGVPVAGALDPVALRLANALVGNAEGEGALEISYLGPTLRVDAQSVRLAVCGPVRLMVKADGALPRALAPDRSHVLKRGEVLEIGPLGAASVAVLAVAGGFACEPVMGSLSTHVRSALGPLGGRPLAAGTVLPLKRDTAPDGGDRVLSDPFDYGAGPVRVVLGPQVHHFTGEAVAALLSESYAVAREADRMGLRLDGPLLAHRTGADIPSDGLVAGAIQVPGNGAPIVLLADHQTAGGYAKIATVISADLPRVGRLVPGSRLVFRAVAVAEAEEARRALERRIRAAISAMGRPKPPGGLDLAALYAADLVSGMVDAIGGD